MKMTPVFGKIRLLLSALLLAGITASGSAETKGVRWLETVYDFGLLKEADGPAPGRMRFVNCSRNPIVITGARPSCGCTGVKYPEEPVAPGDTATLTFTYNPAGRPGPFEKSIRVYFGDYDMDRIKIKGTVLGTQATLEPIYPADAGPMRLSENVLPLADMKFGETRHFFINGYNQTQDTIVPAVKGGRDGLDVDISSPKVAPGELVTFGFYYNSRMAPELGPAEIPVEIISDTLTPGSPSTIVTFRADVKPDFSNMTPEEVKNAPQCYVSPERVDLGIVKGCSVPFSFTIHNQGLSKMHLLRIVPSDKAVVIKKYPVSLKAGKTGVAEGSLNAAALPEGPFRISADVLSDDPLHPRRTITIVGIRE